MGVIVKYQLEFPEAKLKLSNDLYSGQFIIDADITAKMMRGTAGCHFEIKLYDLPLKEVKKLKQSTVVIKLGYFDRPFDTVMEGIVEDIRSEVQEDEIVTTIKGQEKGTYALNNNRFSVSVKASSVGRMIELILKAKKITEGEINTTPHIQNVDDSIGSKSFDEKTLMMILYELATAVKAEFLVCDKEVWIGKPITTDEGGKTKKLHRDDNLASFSPIIQKLKKADKNSEEASEEILSAVPLNLLQPVTAANAEGFKFTITGDPKLRPGQRVAAVVEDFDKEEFKFLVHSVSHKLTRTGGYICEGCAIKACSEKDCRKREMALCPGNAESACEKLTRNNESQRRRQPAIEIGKVKTYTSGQSSASEKHLSTLYFGQSFEDTETQPSINSEVESNEEQIFLDKPIVSPFAWHKCGLVTPVYPGMKALLNHNLSLRDDALVVGFLWSSTPEIRPPQNQEGDWWLCLPIDFDISSPPSDRTKAVNDLIANNGKRVIETKGLKITIGNDQLGNVGERPQEGGDDEFLIEHKSGTKLMIDSAGKLTIEAVNVSIKGNLTVEGNVEVK
jgi:hypothetical protein